jgi:tetratricopeptide (TPR) repeat protein
MDDLVNEEILMKLKKEFDKAVDLQLVIDPKETPYKSKYEARDIYNEIIKTLADLGDDKSHCQAILGGLYCTVGIIDVDVEELSTGETNIVKALKILDEMPEQHLKIISELKALNQLGILWCMREDFEKAKEYLERGLESYLQFMKDNEDKSKTILYELSDLMSASNEIPAPKFEDKDLILELLNTHTYYYLAQVYEKSGNPDKSAECCHITLSKQLELKTFQPLDWATNAAMLSQHYLAKEDYRTTKRHLIAASCILERYKSELDSKEATTDDDEEAKIIEDDREEMLKRCRSDVGRSWGKYCVILLQRSQDMDIERAEQENQLVDLVDHDDTEQVVQVKILDFPSIEADPLLNQIPDKYATNFEEARAIFLPGQKILNAAKNDYYKFQEHCVDYVEIQRDLSHMHKVLVHFEPEHTRKYAIHKRRIDILEPLYKELNHKLFTLLVRQVVYEMAETYTLMMDIKMEMMRRNTSLLTQPNMKKINSLVELSIAAFRAYLATLNKEDGTPPDKYPAENVRPALVAFFHLARLYDKFIMPERSDEKLQNKMQTYCCYKHVVNYCKKHPEAADCMQAELPLCEEMVILLPMKLEKMQRVLYSSSSSSATT